MITTTGIRHRAAAGLLALGLPLALTLAGCGDEGKDSGVASAGGDATDDGGADGGGGTEDMDDRDRMLAFTECLRDNGLDVDDPVEGEGLRMEVGPGTDQEKVEAAMEACREYAPEGGPGGGAIDSEALLEFAQCMRDNGVEAFPDPDPDPDEPGLRITPEIAEDPDFETAKDACQDIMESLRDGAES